MLQTAIQTATAEYPLFTMFTLTIEILLAGTVYKTVFAPAAKSATPNRPVAIYFLL